MWSWRSLGPACSLQAQDEPSNKEASSVMHLSVPVEFQKLLRAKEGVVSKRSFIIRH